MSDKSVVTYDTDHGEVKLSPALIKQYLVSGNPNAVTDQELVMFLQLCKFQKLNPWLREAYLIKYGSEAATMITGKDVFTKRAAKNADFNGLEAGIVVIAESQEAVWREGTLKLPNDIIIGGWARVHRKGWDHPITATVSLEEYIGRKKDGTVTRQWQRMPATMIAKVAKVQSLREAFPEDFQGLYDQAEIPTEGELSEHPVAAPKVQTENNTKEITENPAPEPEPEPVEEPEPKPEPVEEPADDLSSLRAKASKLCAYALEKQVFSQEQHDAFVSQLSNLKSEAALKAMTANFERQLSKIDQQEDIF